jgi:integrase
MKVMKGALGAETWKEYDRRYRRMNKDLTALIENGEISTTNPEKFTEKDVLAYVGSLRARGMRDSGIAHNVDALSSFLRFVGNTAVDKARVRFPQHFPRYARQRLNPIANEDRRKIIDMANTVPDSDWRRQVAYAMAVTGICTGLRPKELRLAKVEDLDLQRGRMHAEEVKGKGRYGEPRNSAIHPDGLPFLRRYLEVRSRMIVNHAPNCIALFPAFKDLDYGGDGFYSQQNQCVLRKIVKSETGVEFDGRACRRTYGQVSIDTGVPLDAVSRMLGHATTKTTETYYCRKTSDAAIAEAQQIWNGQLQIPQLPKVNSPQIENKKWLPGYA